MRSTAITSVIPSSGAFSRRPVTNPTVDPAHGPNMNTEKPKEDE
jgi:hypothetical protein